MKIGIYFCKCGTAISDKIDPDKVKAYLDMQHGMQHGKQEVELHFKTCSLLCSEEGKQFLEQDIKESKVDRVVISACSPREHESTFMGCLTRAGINPYLMQIVNVREQVAWVIADPEMATAKGGRYLDAAISRVKLHEPLLKKEIDVCPDAMIIGAGPAGLKAALALAEAGRKVTLIEKTPVIGGMPVRYEDVFPKMECGPCMLEPLMGDVLHGHSAHNIELLTMAEVTEVVGSLGNFIVKIKQRPRFVDPNKCVGCGECVTPCPVTDKNPFNFNLDEKKAMSFAFAGALPNSTFIEESLCVRSKGEECTKCRDACPVEGAIVFDDKEKSLTRNVGAILVAIGADLLDVSGFTNLGHKKLPDVYSALEFERILSSTGPTGGEIKLRNGEHPKSVAIVHCVGSLDNNHRPYCSGVCCQYSFKFSHLIEKHLPQTKITHFFKELVVPGKEEYAPCSHTRHNANAKMIRYSNIQDLSVKQKGNSNIVEYKTANGATENVAVDLVILSPALVPSKDAGPVSELLEIGRDSMGFFEEAHGRMNAAESKIRGIYLAGTCQAPGDIQRSMSQAMAATGYILSGLVAGRKLEISPVRATVDETRCSGCRICILVCPYKAISFNAEKKVSIVDEVLCQGCGTCVAGCPAGVISGNHFTNQEVFAEIERVLQ